MNTIMENNFVFHSKQMLVKKITKELYVPDTLIEQQEAKKNKEVKQMLKLPSNIKAKFMYWKTKKQKNERTSLTKRKYNYNEFRLRLSCPFGM